jgi:hypothetical protein
MKFSIQVTSGGEVNFAEHSQKGRTLYYGAAPETGLWRVSISRLEDFIATELAAANFGSSVEEFRFGFEIAELEEWGQQFTSMRDYMSYRPKSKTFISVGQLEWKNVKDLSVQEQLAELCKVLVSSVKRISSAKRKPKDFDHAALAQALCAILQTCKASMVAVPA